MSNRFAAVSLYLVFALSIANLAAAQRRNDPSSSSLQSSPDSSSPFDNQAGSARISGTIQTYDGHSISDATIEVRDIERGGRIYTARSDSRGSFELFNVLPGNYEITARSGVDETHDRLNINAKGSESVVELRMGLKPGGAAGKDSTISVAQLNVSAKARELYEKAEALFAKNKFDDTRKKLDQALAASPRFPEALTLRGILQGAQGKANEALTDLQAAITCDPNYPSAYVAMASILNSTGRFADAVPILAHAERLAPTSWQVHFELSRSELAKHDFAEALRDVERASELQGGPQKELPQLHLVRGYALIGLADIARGTHELEVFLAHESTGKMADHARELLDQLHTTTVATTGKGAPGPQ